MASRFAEHLIIQEKTHCTLDFHKNFYRRKMNREESRTIPQSNLINEYLSEFIISVRKKENNGEYEPIYSSLRSVCQLREILEEKVVVIKYKTIDTTKIVNIFILIV